MNDIGKRIRLRRNELGMTAEELAKHIGKDRATVYRYENGDIENLPIRILSPLATALQTTPADLMGYEEAGRKTSSSIIESDIKKYGELSDRDRQMVRDMIDRLYGEAKND